jgi:transketolase
MENTAELTYSTELLSAKADLVRKWCLISTTEATSGHPTSCLSAADITAVLFDKYFTYDLANPLNLYNDRFVLSKGHAAPLLYSLFALAGAYPPEELKTLRKYGSRFEGHPTPHFEFAEAATGSLGQGCRWARDLHWWLKEKICLSRPMYCLVTENWRRDRFGKRPILQRIISLDNLIAIADINRLAQSAETMFGHHIEKYADRFRAFGFEVIEIDGHDFEAIERAFDQAVHHQNGKPVAIVAKTLKGKGISFLEDQDGWHGKALKKEELQKALDELGEIDDGLRFSFKHPVKTQLPVRNEDESVIEINFDKGDTIATREAFGQALTQLGATHPDIYVLDGDVKNSTFTEDFQKAFPDRFVECYIAEQNMVSVAAGLSRLGKTPFVTTFGAFLTRAADQIRMARVSDANIKFVGSHVGVSIGEDGPSQMGLEDIALFGTLPDTVIYQPADAVSTVKLTALLAKERGFGYMRTLRPPTPVLYGEEETFEAGGSMILRRSDQDILTIAATGITVFEALKAADELQDQHISVRVVDCYSINPIDRETLVSCLEETAEPILITIEDHFIHGGMGDFALAAISTLETPYHVEKMGVREISRSGKMNELLDTAGISAERTISRQQEIDLYSHYGWPYYGIVGSGFYGGMGLSGMAESRTPFEESILAAADRKEPVDPHLRSTGDVTGYRIHAADGEIGDVEDFIIDDQTWNVHFLVVDTGHWFPGKKVLISPKWISKIKWEDASVEIAITVNAVKNSPEYDPSVPLPETYENEFYRYYGG